MVYLLKGEVKTHKLVYLLTEGVKTHKLIIFTCEIPLSEYYRHRLIMILVILLYCHERLHKHEGFVQCKGNSSQKKK